MPENSTFAATGLSAENHGSARRLMYALHILPFLVI